MKQIIPVVIGVLVFLLWSTLISIPYSHAQTQRSVKDQQKKEHRKGKTDTAKTNWKNPDNPWSSDSTRPKDRFLDSLTR